MNTPASTSPQALRLASSVAASQTRDNRPPLLPLGAAMVASLLGTSLPVQAQEQTLPTVTVNAEAEPGDGYRATTTRVGKVAQDPHDIPQAVTTVTRSLMDEQQADSLKEALRNVSGLTFNAAEGGRSGDNMMLRGFYTFGDIYLDGMRDTAQYNREVFNLEQVDVLRGAAAMLFGRGQAGGVINQVSKTPMLYGTNKLSASVGTDGYWEAKADLNKRLGETTALRINMMTRDEDSWRSNPATGTTPDIERQGIAPSIAFGLGTDHEVTLAHYYLKTDDRPDYGVPFDSSIKEPNKKYSAETYWGVADNFDKSETNISTLTYLNKISADTQWRTQLRNANYKRSYWATAPSNSDPVADVSSRSAKTRETDTDNQALQTDLNTAFNALGMRHELVTGFEYLKEDSKRWGLLNLGTDTDAHYESGHTNGSPSTYSGDSYALYVQDTVEFMPKWKATVGVRRDQLKADYVSVSGTTSTAYGVDFNENSYRAGLSWQPEESAHYYLSWSDSFSPTADLYQLTGDAYPAERGQVTELGAKWLFFNGDLAFRTALYRAEKEWERSTDLESSATILTKKRRTDGLEFEVAGRVTPNWEIFGGLSLMHGKILEVAPDRTTGSGCSTANPCPINENLEGEMPRNTPKVTLNLWTTYKLGGGWKIGGGMEHKSTRYGYNPGTDTSTNEFDPNKAPAYTRWDAMLAYEQKSYAVKLNVQNLFDKEYYDAIYDNGGFVIPGQGRRVILTTEYKF